MPVNFTDKEWEEYLDKIEHIKPFTNKEWEEFERNLQLRAKNPNFEFYTKLKACPEPQRITEFSSENQVIKFSIQEEFACCSYCCIVIIFLVYFVLTILL